MISKLHRILLPALLLGAAACASQDGPPPGVAEGNAYLEEGRELLRTGHVDEAARRFTSAVKANPDLAEAWYERGRCEISMRLDPKIEGDLRVFEQRAYDDFSTAIRKNPAYGDAYFNRAMILCSRAQYKLAADDLLNAIRYKNRDAEAHRWLGDLYENKFQDAILLAMDHYEKYVDLGGSDPAVREKVRIWKDFKKQPAAITPEPAAKVPTAEDEKKAQELHAKALEQ